MVICVSSDNLGTYICCLQTEVMIESYASFQYDIPTFALYGWGPGRQVQAFIWERGQKVGMSGYQDWILKAIAQKITTDAGGSIGEPQQQSSTGDLLMMTMTKIKSKVMMKKMGKMMMMLSGRSHSLIGDGGEQCHCLSVIQSVTLRTHHRFFDCVTL